MGTHQRVGIIGVGQMGCHHAQLLTGRDDVDLVAVADVNRERAMRVADEFGCVALDPAELIERGSLDGVVIAAPDETHAGYTCDAITSGLMVLCEKPSATHTDDAARVCWAEAVHAKRRVVQVGFMRAFDDELTALSGRLDSGLSARLLHHNPNGGRRRLKTIVRQSMVHEAHMARRLFGSIEHVTGHDCGSVVAAEFQFVAGGSAWVEFHDDAERYHVEVTVAGQRWRRTADDWVDAFADEYRAQCDAWVGSLAAGVAVGPSSFDGFEAQRTVDAVLASIDRGGPVWL